MLDGDSPFTTHNSSRENSRNLGWADDIRLRNDCPLCVCIFDLVAYNVESSSTDRSYYQDTQIPVFAVWSAHHLQQDVLPSLDPGHQSDVCIKAMPASKTSILSEMTYPDESVDSLALVRAADDRRLFKVEVIDQKLLDVLGLKQCLRVCDRSHGDRCRGSGAEIDSPAGFLLVDV